MAEAPSFFREKERFCRRPAARPVDLKASSSTLDTRHRDFHFGR
jgi:hypothetical protein